MAEGKISFLHVVDTDEICQYSLADLDYFNGVLDDILAEMLERNDRRADPWNRVALKFQLESALFRCAATGERDEAALKHRAVSALPMVSALWPTDA